jgi:C1A family cysteine protease
MESYIMQVQRKGFGYIPDLPHAEDFTVNNIEENVLPKNLLRGSRRPVALLPNTVNNSQWCSPYEDQGELGACGMSSIDILEYMEKKAFGKYINGSKLFTYWHTRKMMGEQYVNIDSGVYNRTAMKAIVKIGILPDEFWPYKIDTFTNPPTPEMYQNLIPYRALNYIRLDNSYGDAYVSRIKQFLNSGYIMFTGFTVYDNIDRITKQEPVLEYPVRGVDKPVGGHAVLITGYDDDVSTKTGNGVFRIRNSWGAEWGDGGDFYMPYKYFVDGIALDTWTITSLAYMDSKQFD